jgi:pyrroline-5-carboxylate reductase
MSVIALVGVGKMGEAILAGLVRNTPPADILVTARRTERAAELTAKYGVQAVSNETAFAQADELLVLVKPVDVLPLLEAHKNLLKPSALVISLAAGLRTERIENALSGQAVVRVMPNTPALVGAGMSILSAGASCSTENLEVANLLMKSVGKTIVVPESSQDAMTAISGSGPAYFFYFVEGLIEAAVDLGISPIDAQLLAQQTLLGAALLLDAATEEPAQLRANVTSKGGVTAAAIAEFDAADMKALIARAVKAARDRSEEMANS